MPGDETDLTAPEAADIDTDGDEGEVDVDAAEREFFEQRYGRSPEPEESDEDDDEPVPKARTKDEDDDEEDAEEAEAPKRQPAAKGEQVDKDALAAAFKALRRDNVPQDVIDHWLANDPEKLLAWADEAGKRQKGIDERLTAGAKPTAETKETKADGQPEATATPGPDDAIKALVAPFAEDIASDVAVETLTKLAAHTRQATIAEIQPLLDAHKEQLAQLSNVADLLLRQNVRGNLKERFPEIADDAVWSKIEAKAEQLATAEGYRGKGYEAVFADAARIELGEFNKRAAQQRMYEAQRKRSRSQPSEPVRQPRKAPATIEEQERAAFDAIKRGKDPNQAMASLRSA